MALAPRAWGAEFEIVKFGVEGKSLFEACGEYAVVDVKGPLEQHAWFFADSYDSIRARVAAALASDAAAVCLRINSPGGDFAGAIELSRELRTMAQTAKKALVAFTDSSALSAAYALACACSEIVITPSASVGSIGVWAPLVDETAKDAAQGLAILIVASGTRKADRNPHMGITEGAIAGLQAQIDTMAGLFFDHVSQARGMPREGVESLQGAELFGAEAVTLQLASRIVNSWGDFLTLNEGRAMAKSFGENKKAYREALAKTAEGDDEDAKAARKALAAFEKEDADEKAADDAEKEKAAAKSADDDAAAKAAADDDKEKEAKAAADEKEAKAAASAGRVAASSPATMAMAARLQALEAKEARRDEADARAKALAGRPDFSPEVKAFVDSLSLADALKACKNLPRGSVQSPAVASAVTPGGTRGLGQGEGGAEGEPTEEEATFIREKMYGKDTVAGVEHKGRTSTFAFMTPDQAQAALKRLNAGKVVA